MRIPHQMKERNQWMCWLNVDGTKTPKRPDGREGKSNDSATWTDFETAEDASQFFSGLAFVISNEDNLTGIDLDNCLDEKGNLRDWAIPIISRFDGVGYAEISPSGQGIKIVTQGSKTSSRCTHKIGDNKQQIECYDENRFWTVTGNIYAGNDEILDGQAAVDWLCETYLKTDQLAAVATQPLPRSVDPVSLESRAQKYLDAVPLPSEGERNNVVFRTAGHLKSIVDEYGRSLPEDVIVDMLKNWGTDLPLEEVEIAARSAFVNGTPRPIKAHEERQPRITAQKQDGPPELDAAGFRELHKQQEAAKSQKRTTQKLPDEVFETAPGFIGEYWRFLDGNAAKPLPEAHLGAALSVLSTITGSWFSMPFWQWDTRSNMYIFCLAPSGAGKDFARQQNARLIHQVEGMPSRFLGHDRFTSSTAFYTDLMEHSARLWQLDEFSKMIGDINNQRSGHHVTSKAEVLLTLFSRSADPQYKAQAYADQGKSIELKYPHPVIYATSTPDEFWNNLTSGQALDGLIGRFLILEDDYSDARGGSWGDATADPEDCAVYNNQIIEDFPSNVSEPLCGLLAMVNEIDSPLRMRIRIPASKRLMNHIDGIDDRKKSEKGAKAAIWGRASEKTAKLAMLSALARQSEIVEKSDADWAISFNNAMTRRLIDRVENAMCESQHEMHVRKVLRIVENAGGAVTRKQLIRAARWLRKRDRDEIVDTLIESGDLVSGFGKPLFAKGPAPLWYATDFNRIADAIGDD